jgi:hypothetical protein
VHAPFTLLLAYSAAAAAQVALYAIGTPFTAFVFEMGCFQPYPLIFSALLTMPFICSSYVIRVCVNVV